MLAQQNRGALEVVRPIEVEIARQQAIANAFFGEREKRRGKNAGAAPRNAAEHRRLKPARADKIVAAVGRGTENNVRRIEYAKRMPHSLRRHPWSVRADDDDLSCAGAEEHAQCIVHSRAEIAALLRSTIPVGRKLKVLRQNGGIFRRPSGKQPFFATGDGAHEGDGILDASAVE